MKKRSFWWIFGLFVKGYPYEKTSILTDFWTFRKGVPLWKNVNFDGFFALRKEVPLPLWQNTDVYNFFVIFTIYTLLLALKLQQTVVWLKGHQFWEVDFWWLFDHFYRYHLYVFFGSKIGRNGRMTKRTPVLRNRFLMIFWSFSPCIRVFWL